MLISISAVYDRIWSYNVTLRYLGFTGSRKSICQSPFTITVTLILG